MQYCRFERLSKALNADTTVNSRDRLNGAGASDASVQKNIVGPRGSNSGARPKEGYSGGSVDAMSKKELQETLGKLGLATTGLKAELRERLEAAIQSGINDEDDSDVEDDDESEEGEKTGGDHFRDDRESTSATTRSRGVTSGRANAAPSCGGMTNCSREHTATGPSTLSFKDVEDALDCFSADGTQNV